MVWISFNVLQRGMKKHLNLFFFFFLVAIGAKKVPTSNKLTTAYQIFRYSVFYSVFSRIRNEYWNLPTTACAPPHSLWIWENTGKNSIITHILCNAQDIDLILTFSPRYPYNKKRKNTNVIVQITRNANKKLNAFVAVHDFFFKKNFSFENITMCILFHFRLYDFHVKRETRILTIHQAKVKIIL